MKVIKYIYFPLLTIIMIFLYFHVWLVDEGKILNQINFSRYFALNFLATFYYFLAWIPLIIFIRYMLKFKKLKDKRWKIFAVNTVSIIIYCIVITIGIINGYLVTV